VRFPWQHPARDNKDEKGLKVLNWWRGRRARKKRRLAAMTRKRRVWRRVGVTATWLLAFVAVVMLVGVIGFYQLSDVPSPADITENQVATIEWADGSTMARIGTEDRTIVALSKVPETVRWAVLAAEDRGFYSEPGVSVKGTLRAALSDLTGGNTQGGSGITQQYVKNAYLSDRQTVSRKIKELAISVKLSRDYSKEQILEYYLNTIYFGRGAYGIEAAAEAFFGIASDELTTTQGALLAGLLQAPNTYDPANDLAAATRRWNYVLDGMVSTKHLTAADRAGEVFPATIPQRQNNGLGVSGPEALIVRRVVSELAAQGISEAEMYAKGLTIQTTINKTAQVEAEQTISTIFGQVPTIQQNMKQALIAVNPATGGVLAYYGGSDPTGLDYAAQGCVRPGSSFKPYTLATALSQTVQGKQPGYTIKSIVDGSQTVEVQGIPISNDPSDRQYAGFHPVDFAMKVSLNTVFDAMANTIGPANVAATAHAAGISAGCGNLQDSNGVTPFGIGIGDLPVHPVDQAVGYSTIENGGVENDGYFVQKVTNSQGSVIYAHKADPRPAMDARVANDVTLTLEPIAGFSGVGLADGRASAAKTGTEGIESGPDTGKNSDAWMVGFTPQMSVAVWVGSGDATHAIYNASGGEEYGRDLPGKTWKLFLNSYLRNAPELRLPSRQMVFAPENALATLSASAPPSTSSASATASVPSASSSLLPSASGTQATTTKPKPIVSCVTTARGPLKPPKVVCTTKIARPGG
jgi:membrane peptidoglycan carboxypeptidase